MIDRKQAWHSFGAAARNHAGPLRLLHELLTAKPAGSDLLQQSWRGLEPQLERVVVMVAHATSLLDAPSERRTDAHWLNTNAERNHSGEALDTLVLMSLASLGRKMTPSYAKASLLLAFGNGPVVSLLRDMTLGNIPAEGQPKPWTEPPVGDTIPLDKLERLACYRELSGGLAQISTSSAGLGISKLRLEAIVSTLEPNPAIVGEWVRLRGANFGTRPDPLKTGDKRVLFGTTSASWRVWTNEVIEAQVPAGLSGGVAISIASAMSEDNSAAAYLEGVGRVVGAMSTCWGAAGKVAGARLIGLASSLVISGAAPQSDGRNLLFVGPPVIDDFSGRPSAQWYPFQPVGLNWRVLGSSDLSILVMPMSGHPHASVVPRLASPENATGSLDFPPQESLEPWRARYTLTARNRCGDISKALDIDFRSRLGIVVVGGGMRSSFHVGALEALQRLVPQVPQVVAGTGFGGLAAYTYGTGNLAPLRAFWSAMNWSDDLYDHDAVVGNLATLDSGAYQGFMVNARRTADILAMGYASRAGLPLPPLPNTTIDDVLLEELIGVAQDNAVDVGVDLTNHLVVQAVGSSSALGGALNSVPVVALLLLAAKIAIRTVSVNEVNIKVAAAAARRGVRGSATLQAAINTALSSSGSLAAGTRFRVPLGCLETADVAYANESAQIVSQPSGSLIATGVSMAGVLHASAATPAWTAPVKLGSFNFIDGISIDPAPVAAVIDAGADHVFVIQPTLRDIRPIDSFDGVGFVTIDQRAGQMRERGFADSAIAPLERWQRDRVGGFNAHIEMIEATLDLSGMEGFSAESGLLGIWRDYGYLRTFDVLAPRWIYPSATQAQERNNLQKLLTTNSDAITTQRYAAWYVEHNLNGERHLWNRAPVSTEVVPVSSSDGVDSLRQTKSGLRELIVQRLTHVRITYRGAGADARFPPIAAVPANFSDWFLQWEQHPWEWRISGAFFNPWGELIGFATGQTAAAAPVPPAIDPALFSPI